MRTDCAKHLVSQLIKTQITNENVKDIGDAGSLHSQCTIPCIPKPARVMIYPLLEVAKLRLQLSHLSFRLGAEELVNWERDRPIVTKEPHFNERQPEKEID